MKKWLRRLIIVWQYIYETRIAPFFANYAYLPWYYVYKYFKKRNIVFFANIADGTGQFLPELDFALRIIDSKKKAHLKFVLLKPKNDFTRKLLPLYRHLFWGCYANTLLYNIALPMIMRFQDLTINAGISGLHWQLPPRGKKLSPAKPWQTYLFADPKSSALSRWIDYYKLKSQKPNIFPLQNSNDKLAIDTDLLNFLQNKQDNMVLIHIKTNVMNATAKTTDPQTYIKTLRFLNESKFNLIFVGREKMPKEFTQLNILNYSESTVASFEHDLQLFNHAKFSITGGSGIAWIADCLGKPVLYLNSWHNFMPPFNKQCIFVPTLVEDKSNNFLSYKKQFNLYLNTRTDKGDVFPFENFNARNASDDEIFNATQELLNLIHSNPPLTPDQIKYMKLGKIGWMKYSQARISQYFAQKHTTLLH